jgi:acyl-coenzyme A thioesterase PaaI-like protein
MSFSPTPPPRTVVPFHDHAQIEILDAPGGTGAARIPDARELRNHLGTVHAGMLFALGDAAAGTAMARLLGPDASRLRAVTRRGAIEYLKPARGAISGAASIGMSAADIAASLSRSRSVDVPIQVELTDAAGFVVARLGIDFFVGVPKS